MQPNGMLCSYVSTYICTYVCLCIIYTLEKFPYVLIWWIVKFWDSRF